MTDLSRGARSRRSGRRPGWLLLTVLLVLAIAASSALVFTQRVELLKLAVILSLWAAAAAAFVSVIYRRQSDIDRAKARDLKLVYDLQLDREISARREYELEVESQLRRELAIEVRAQAADEVASLRAELAALRNNLEVLFDADLSHRPAIEPERTTVRAYSDWQRDAHITDPGRRPPRFVASTPRQDADDGSENAIIDVPEEPPVPVDEIRAAPEPRHAFEPRPQPSPASLWEDSHPSERYSDPEPEGSRYAAPDPVFLPPQPPEPQPAERGGRHGVRTPQPGDWQPVPAEGQWLPPGAPSSNWAPTNGTPAPAADPMSPAPEPVPAPGGRHGNPVEPYAVPTTEAPSARHSTDNNHIPPPAPIVEPATAPGGSDNVPHPESQHGEGHGQSVAELLARLQAGAGPTGGGRRRRRDG
ncbi:MAG TPA: DUF6779 domain-containing protein [Mycobacterium sp.]|nr:DUF6779 domain-containing protein [Mycobacterium sp.]